MVLIFFRLIKVYKMKRFLPRTFITKRGRNVTTWSPLATAFNTRPKGYIGLNIMKEKTGLFQKPELKSFEGFYALKDEAIVKTENLIDEATSGNSKRPLVEIFDELSDTLCKVADLAEFVRIAHPNAQYRSAAEDACISISGVVEKLNTHRPLYDALKSSFKRGDSGDQHLAELFLFDFEQSGIHLDKKPRDRVVDLNDNILQTGQRFMAGCSNPRRMLINTVPPNIRHFFHNDGDQLVISGLYADSSDPVAREAAYKFYLSPDQYQDVLLNQLLESRREMANICGFSCYADRAIKGSTMESAPDVRKFIDILSDNLYDRANLDFQAMQQMKKAETPHCDQVGCWDTPYFTHKAKTDWLQVATAEYSPYFSLGACMDGINLLLQSLYGISLDYEEMQPGESWAPDVCKLAVVHESEGLLGHIYCDFYERENKPHQDCHFTIRGGKLLPDGTYQNPIVVVMLSLNAGGWSGPALLSLGGVDNLFHELGHALHAMLGRAKWQHAAGTRAHTDLAELPSVLMEYFASSPKVLRLFAKHFQTQEPIPEKMLQRLCAAKNLFGASEMQLQVFYSALDQHYHGPNASFNGRSTDVLKEVQKKYYGLPYVENTAWQHRFSHLVGYGAKYYSYLISRALSWTVWKTNFMADPLSRAAGEAFREGVLSHGGAKPPLKLVNDYLKTDVTPNLLAMSLPEELDYHSEFIKSVREK